MPSYGREMLGLPVASLNTKARLGITKSYQGGTQLCPAHFQMCFQEGSGNQKRQCCRLRLTHRDVDGQVQHECGDFGLNLSQQSWCRASGAIKREMLIN